MSASYNAKFPHKWCWCELATFELHSFTCPKAKDTDIFKMVKKTKKPETNVLCCGCRLYFQGRMCIDYRIQFKWLNLVNVSPLGNLSRLINKWLKVSKLP